MGTRNWGDDWNGLDADPTRVDLRLEYGEVGMTKIILRDSGQRTPLEEAPTRFTPARQMEGTDQIGVKIHSKPSWMVGILVGYWPPQRALKLI